MLEVLRSMKWEYMYGHDIERDYSDPTLPDVFEYQVRKLNKGVPDEAVNDAIRQVRGIAGGSVVVRNAIFTDWLQNGGDGACRVSGDDTTRLVQLIDYAHPEKNAFHAVNQWTVQNGEVVKRPDVVLFVNGKPLVVIELKNPSKPETTVHEAFLQLRNHQHDIPDLFTYNQICVASDMVSTRAGSLTAGESWFKEWKSIDGEREEGGVGNFETLFKGLLEPKRLLDVVKNFICFSGKGPKADKILAGYHQYFAAEGEADEAVIEQSKRDQSQMEVLLGHDDTVKSLVDDILEHYEKYREKNLAGKAMIVAYSRPIAIKIYKRFLKLRPAWGKSGKIQVVMTEGNQDPEEWRDIIGNKKAREKRALQFKDVASPFKIAIVVDMWLTGFDVPCLDTMYVYKPMVGHNLMQAIARVNRVYGDKEGGLVVDYIGIAAALKDAMNQYTVRDRKKYGNPDVAKIAKPKFYEHLEVCRAQLHGYGYSKGIDGSDLERAKAINGAVNFLLAPARKRQKEIFLENAYQMKQALSLCAALIPERDRFEAGFMEAVRGMINQWTISGSGGEKKGLAELNAQIAEMVKQSVASEGVINLFSDRKAAVSLFDAAFLAEIRRMKEKNLAVEILKKLLSESVKLHARKNLVKSEEFSELLSKAMKEYINGHITNEEVIKRLIELATRIKEGIDSTPKGLTEDEAAFYDALSKPEAVKKFYTDDTLIQLTKELTDQLRRNRTVDWDRRDSARAHMRMLVKRLLKKYKYPPEEAKDALETVMRQCELWVDEPEYEDKAEAALPHPGSMWQGRPRPCEDPYEYAEAATTGDSKENTDDGYDASK